MIIFVENKLQEAQILEIWETEDDKLLSVNKLREKYIAYARSHFIKMPPLVIENQETKWKIEITTQVLKEWRQKSRTRKRIIAIQLLDTMLKTAILVKTGDDTRKTRNIVNVSEFENRCRIEGDMNKIRIIVKKQPNRHFMYYYGAVNIEGKKNRDNGYHR
jgi:hypothetical protein